MPAHVHRGVAALTSRPETAKHNVLRGIFAQNAPTIQSSAKEAKQR